MAYVSPSKDQKGNKNFPKFLIKTYFKFVKDFVEPESQKYIKYLESLKKKVYSKNRKKHNTQDLYKIIKD